MRATGARPLSLLVALLLAAATARAQDLSLTDAPPPSQAPLPGAEGLSGPVVSVRLEPPMSGENPWSRTGLAPNAEFTPAAARAALRVALATGTFAEAVVSARRSADGRGVEVVIRGERRYRLQSYVLHGVEARTQDEVGQDLNLSPRGAVTESAVEAAMRRVTRAYRDQGFVDVDVGYTWRETDDPAVRVLVVEVREGAPARVGSVTLEGVPADVLSDVRTALAIRRGDVAVPRAASTGRDAALRVLRARGHLAASASEPVWTTRAQGAGAATLRDLTLRFTPGDRYRVAWQGLRSFPVEGMNAALRLEDERGFDGATLDALLARVKDYYVRRGFLDAEVSAVVAPDGEGRRVVRITIREGQQVWISRMTFAGAHAFTQEQLRATVESALTSELPDDPSPYTTERLDRARTYVPALFAEVVRERIVRRYRERGYLDARVSAPTTERVPDPRGPRDPRGVPHPPTLAVRFEVTEGPQTFIEEVRFEGHRAASSARLASEMNLELGLPLSYASVDEARVRLLAWYREEGFAFARVEPEVERSPDRTRARVKVVIHEGPRVRVGSIRVRGNTRTPADIVLTRLAFGVGDVYRTSEVQSSQRRLGELGIFSGINVALEDPDVEAPVKTVVVSVAERTPQSLELRGGFSTGEGLRAGFEYSHLNVFARAVSFSLRARGGFLVQIPGITPQFPIEPRFSQLLNWRVSASLGFGYVPVLGYGWGSTVDLSSTRLLQPPFYAITTHAVGVSITNRTVRNLSLSLTPEFQYVTTDLFGRNTIDGFLQDEFMRCTSGGFPEEQCLVRQQTLQQQLLRYSSGTSVLFSLRFGLAYDRRNSAFTPTRGFIVSAGTEWLQVLDADDSNLTSSVLQVTGRVTGYVPIPINDIVLMLSFRAGRNFALGPAGSSGTHPSRRFWLGGADSMRGWLQNQLVPQDVVDARASSTTGNVQLTQGSAGGEFFVNAVADLRIPTPACFSLGCVQIGLFVDVGNLWSKVPDLSDLYRLRWSPGIGLRLASPFGLVALDFGFNPLHRDEVRESVWALQFSLGSG
ncbi:MAG: POTRA domain-containing protein [Polyangiales bacterium]